MQKFILLYSLLLLSVNLSAQEIQISPGKWKVKLLPNDSIEMPFFFEIKLNQSKKYNFTILNGEERINILNYKQKEDSLFIELPIFNSELKIQILDEYNLCGKWYNYAKGSDYKIPLIGFKTNEERFVFEENSKDQINFTGKYQTTFSTKKNPWVAIGLFNQRKNKITGTFLTETGDFRFLEGNVNGNEMKLSCFDGSHAFYFDGRFENDSIKGTFYSGNHYHTDWVAVKNNNYQLRSPDSITKTVNNETSLKFTLPDLDSNLFVFPNTKYQNKVTIIQIMGSWCPNCMDETKYYQTLYKKYNNKGLEIIAVAFETPKDFHSKARMLKKLKNHFNIQYKIIVGGDASKKIASEVFPNLNSIVSFPTSIFLDKDNNIRKIHTGFNGPGTNKHYKDYIKKTESLIKDLLEELD